MVTWKGIVVLLALSIFSAQCSRLIHEDGKELLRPENAPMYVENNRVRPALQRGEPSIVHQTEVNESPFEAFNDEGRVSPIDISRTSRNVDTTTKNLRTISETKPYVNPNEMYNHAPPTEDKDVANGPSEDVTMPQAGPVGEITDPIGSGGIYPKPGPEDTQKHSPIDAVGPPQSPDDNAEPQPKIAPGAHDMDLPPGADERPAPDRRRLISFFDLGDVIQPMVGGASPDKPSASKPEPGAEPVDAATQTWLASPSMGSSGVNGDYLRLQSQLALVSSPHSADSADEAYIAVTTAQDMCSNDFVRVCSAPLGASELTFPDGGFAASARIVGPSAEAHEVQAMPVLDLIKSFFGTISSGAGIPGDQDITISWDISGEYDDNDDNWYADNAVNDDHMELAMPCDHTAGGKLAVESHGITEVRPENGMALTNSRALYEHKQVDWKGHDDHHHGEEHRWKEVNEKEDEDPASDIYSRYQQTLQGNPSYASYMGFGMEGDQCLIANYDQLSPACQAALDDVVTLREEYIVEEKGCGFPIQLVLLGLLAALIATCLCCTRKKNMTWKARVGNVKAILAAIHADTDLKARVEAASGVPVPPASCCKENSTGGKCTLTKIIVGVLSICVSFFMVRIAAGITMNIAVGMVYEKEDGTQVVPNPVFILIIFIALLAVELLVLVGLKKVADCCLARRSPLQRPTACSSYQQPQGGGSGYLPVLPKFAVPQFTPPRLPAFIRKSNHRDAYEPLMTEHNSSATELVQTPTSYYEQASAPHEHMTYVPPSTYVVAQQVPAQSLSTFSMV